MVRSPTVGVRLDPDIIARLDALAAALSERAAGAAINRSDAARLAIARGVDVLEAEIGRKPSGATKPRRTPK